MSTDAQDDDDVGPGLALRVAIEYVIVEAVEEDPERVIRALAGVVDRCKAEGRYSAEEIDVAAAQLCRELGIARKTN
jgi:hypothetical protein